MSNDDWWFGCIGAKSGWFPTSFVRLRVGTVDDEESSLKEKEEIFEPEQLPSPLQPIKTIELDTHLCLQPPEDKVGVAAILHYWAFEAITNHLLKIYPTSLSLLS